LGIFAVCFSSAPFSRGRVILLPGSSAVALRMGATFFYHRSFLSKANYAL
jgi:hypothetical protein